MLKSSIQVWGPRTLQWSKQLLFKDVVTHHRKPTSHLLSTTCLLHEPPFFRYLIWGMGLIGATVWPKHFTQNASLSPKEHWTRSPLGTLISGRHLVLQSRLQSSSEKEFAHCQVFSVSCVMVLLACFCIQTVLLQRHRHRKCFDTFISVTHVTVNAVCLSFAWHQITDQVTHLWWSLFEHTINRGVMGQNQTRGVQRTRSVWLLVKPHHDLRRHRVFMWKVISDDDVFRELVTGHTDLNVKFPGSELFSKHSITECNVLYEPLEGSIYQTFHLPLHKFASISDRIQCLFLKARPGLDVFSTVSTLCYGGLTSLVTWPEVLILLFWWNSPAPSTGRTPDSQCTGLNSVLIKIKNSTRLQIHYALRKR